MNKPPLIPRNTELTRAIDEAKHKSLWNWPRPTKRSWENRSYAKVKAKVTLPKLGDKS
jgi:hypothetical protein